MVKHFDHVTIVVRDVEAAKQFFGLLGFNEDKSVVIAGPQFSAYMGVDSIEAEHVTLVLANVSPRTEVQLLKYRHPDPPSRPGYSQPHQTGVQPRLLRRGRPGGRGGKAESEGRPTPERDHGLP
jgi:catechol 2,3-dioxygenase-like lactoylglutathione lyase family enzyme